MSIPRPSWTDAGFVLGNWEVRPRHGTLVRRDLEPAEPVRVEPKVMSVLSCLARHGGEVVTRDEFSAEVWGGRVVSDEALSRCISLLRQVLADDSREPRFIRTIARIGYALVPVPMPLASGGVDAKPPPPAGPAAPAAIEVGRVKALSPWTRLRSRRLSRHTVVVVSCIGLIGALVLIYAGLRSGPAAPPTRLLVLAFDTRRATSLGGDAGIELADEIADSLAHLARLQVSGRTSADTLAAAHTGALEAGRKLGVDAVLNGEIVESPGGGLRTTVRLTAMKDARVLWSRVYERHASDVFALQSTIAAAVERELLGRESRESLAAMPSVAPDSHDFEAYKLYLRGAHQLRLRGEDSLRRAVDLFSAAARRDPSYARAQIGLASAYALLPSYSYEDPAEMYALAEKALANADRLSGNPSQSAGTRAYLGFMRGNWIAAETAFRTAIAADPNNPDVRQMYSQLLGAVGRIDAALAQARLAQEIDPLAPVVADRLGILHLWLGRDAEAESDTALARELGLDEVAYPETKGSSQAASARRRRRSG